MSNDRKDSPPKNLLVSVIINNYNYARFLSAAIESALNQTYQNTEIIVVDDGSTDESRQVMESYGSRIIAVYKDNGGQASAMNRGYELSKGELIYFLDADDIALPDCLEQIVRRFNHVGEAAILQFKLQIIDKEGILTDRFMPDIEKLQGGEARRLLGQKGSYVFPPTSGNVFSRNALERIMPIPEHDYRVCADIYLCTMAVLTGTVEVFEETLGHYRIHGENNWASPLMNENANEQVEEFVKMMLEETSVRRRSKRITANYLSRPIGGNTDLLYLIFKSTSQKLLKNTIGDEDKKGRWAMAKQFMVELRQDASVVPVRNKIAAMLYLTTIALLPKTLVYSLVKYTFVCPPKSVDLMLKKSFS